MLPATEQDIERVTAYMHSEAPNLAVQLVQKVYAENVLQVRHEIWDVHTNVDRWWVITEPMKLSDFPVEPFVACYRQLQEASDALSQAREVTDYQAIGVRCREALLAFVSAARDVAPWQSEEPAPKRADFKAWIDYICNVALHGSPHANRRQLFKTLMDAAWGFSNWLTHAQGSHSHDAEAAVAACDNAIALCTAAVIQHVRGVPDQCPECGSQRLSPERGYHTSMPAVEWERPTCDACGWVGEPTPVTVRNDREDRSLAEPTGECVIQSTPLRSLRRPSKRDE